MTDEDSMTIQLSWNSEEATSYFKKSGSSILKFGYSRGTIQLFPSLLLSK